LLLGWDETPDTTGPPRPSALTLAHDLAPTLPLAVLLPHLPEVVELIPQAQITGLGNLDPQQLSTAQREPGAWQAPAAPYAGAQPPQPTATQPAVVPAGGPTSIAAAPPRPASVPVPASAPTAGGEPGPAEASALSQSEDNLTLPTPAPPAPSPSPILTAAQQPLLRALAALRTEGDDGADLNFRVIQYARFAAPQAVGQEFAVIYAADWPVWLAALEIRQLTGRPLVLHVHSLAADRNTPADRGWALELERLTLRRADLVLAATPAVAERLGQLYTLPPGRCRVVAPDDTAALHAVLNSFTPAA
jgi:hypothetical protein